MNGAVRGRRLASPVRLALAVQLGTPLDGAWWPHTASIPRELPELLDALSARLGEIIAISVNWSSLEGSPDMDSLTCLKAKRPNGASAHQRLMMITGSKASASLLVIPCRTSTALAVMVMRQAATFRILPTELHTREYQTSEDIVQAVRAQSALCAGRQSVSGAAQPTVAVSEVSA